MRDKRSENVVRIAARSPRDDHLDRALRKIGKGRRDKRKAEKSKNDRAHFIFTAFLPDLFVSVFWVITH
jgi:hypothetical protein